MTHPTEKNWFRRQGAPEQPTASASDVEGGDRPTNRIAAYASAWSPDTSSNAGGDGEHDAASASESPPHRSAGEEVDAILQTARDAAAKLTEAATKEAEQTRAAANSAATREVEEAHHHAEGERQQAAKERADAEAYAAQLRSEAEAAAEKLRAEAEHEASTLVEGARASLAAADTKVAQKLAAADAQVEQQLRTAEESAGARVGALQAEVRRYEERLHQLLAVFRGMSLKVEAVLEEGNEDALDVEPAEQDRAAEPADKDLGEALRRPGVHA